MLMRDINVICGRSGDLAQIYYNENFTALEDGRNMPSLLIYHSCCDERMVSRSDLVEINRKGTLKNRFIEFLFDEDQSECWERHFDTKTDVRNARKDDLADAVQDELYELLTYGDLEDVTEVADKFGILIKADSYERISSRGYSQGDYVEVMVPDEWMKDGIQEEVDHLIWDAPIYFRIEANGEDLVYEEEVLKDGFYEWDRDDVIEEIKKLKLFNTRELEEIESQIPEYPEYTY